MGGPDDPVPAGHRRDPGVAGERPLHLTTDAITEYVNAARTWITEHQSDLASTAIGASGTIVEGFTGFALAIFASVFFLLGGREIWAWMVGLFPVRQRGRIDGVGQVAWGSFAGYTRGIVIVAFVNAVLVLFGLLILSVPLAFPLALLVFLFSFIPLIGAPIATAIAAVVALAARGPLIALAVIVLIVLVGQFEGHVLQTAGDEQGRQLAPARGRCRRGRRDCHGGYRRCGDRRAIGGGALFQHPVLGQHRLALGIHATPADPTGTGAALP